MQREERDSGHPLFVRRVVMIRASVLCAFVCMYVAFSRRAKPRESRRYHRARSSSACSCVYRERKSECTVKMHAGTRRCSGFCWLTIALLVGLLVSDTGGVWKRREDKTKCPKVKGIRNFDISEFLGLWYIVQYYASSEEALAYRCMRAELSVSPESAEVTMNFTYSFTDDPINELLVGNITWKIPSTDLPAHWVHAEFPYEGVYNTYVLDSDYKSWALLMHCAEKSESPRYLSSLIMSREASLGPNVISYLREKLPRYDIDLEYMFPMDQKQCNKTNNEDMLMPVLESTKRINAVRRHPLKRKHRRQ